MMMKSLLQFILCLLLSENVTLIFTGAGTFPLLTKSANSVIALPAQTTAFVLVI